jgi:hypothetical protein
MVAHTRQQAARGEKRKKASHGGEAAGTEACAGGGEGIRYMYAPRLQQAGGDRPRYRARREGGRGGRAALTRGGSFLNRVTRTQVA